MQAILASFALILTVDGPISAGVAGHLVEPSEEVRAALRVDTSEVGTSGPVIRRRIEERGNLVLRQAEVLPAGAGGHPVILVVVRETTGDDPGYQLEITVEQAGAVVEGSRRAIECPLCTESDLVERAEEAITTFVPVVRDVARSRRAEGGPAGEAGETGTQSPIAPAKPASEPGEDRPLLGVMGKTGAGVLGAGVVGVAVGLGLGLREPTPLQGDEAWKRLDTRTAGWVVLGVGAAALVTGSVLVAVDVIRHKRHMAASPWLGPHGAGLAVGGRF